MITLETALTILVLVVAVLLILYLCWMAFGLYFFRRMLGRFK